MKYIGRKIYFDIETGNIILNTGERQGSVHTTTIEKDIATFTALSKRNRDTFDVLELPFGAYAQDFAESNGYRVNPETKELEFIYFDPNEPEVEQPYQAPLSEEVSSLKDENLMNMMAMVDMYENNLRLESENTSTMLAVAELYEMILGGA